MIIQLQHYCGGKNLVSRNKKIDQTISVLINSSMDCDAEEAELDLTQLTKNPQLTSLTKNTQAVPRIPMTAE